MLSRQQTFHCGGERRMEEQLTKDAMNSSDIDDVLNNPSLIKRTLTSTLVVEQLGIRDITYMASLRAELWQSLAIHLTRHNTEQCCKALECLDKIEYYWGEEAQNQVRTCLKLVELENFQEASLIVTDTSSEMTVKTGDMPEDQVSFCVLLVMPRHHYLNKNVHTSVAAELRRVAKLEVDRHGGKVHRNLKYRLVEVDSARKGLMAILLNPTILAVVLHDNITIDSPVNNNISLVLNLGMLETLEDTFMRGMGEFVEKALDKMKSGAPVLFTLVKAMKTWRPELSLFCICNLTGLSELSAVSHLVNRSFAEFEDHSDLHEAILNAIQTKQQAPFFDNLREYAERPIGVFHALAISRGNSIRRSRWIQHLIDFYGINIFKAESSATCGGLDSLLCPHGALKDAQSRAARAFGAGYCFFCTNGTSTSNKIVIQALVRHGDVILVDRNCHKSHHYGAILCGAKPCYMDAYPLDMYSMYGGVELSTIKRTLLSYRAVGRLDEIGLMILTNCTFDGIVYNPERLIEECLAIKPDLAFLFDEAWFAYATFHPVFKSRTAMFSARNIRGKLREKRYDLPYKEMLHALNVKSLDDVEDMESLVKTRLYPNPKKMKVRVYATQSIHKSLTALRQASVILCNDDLFESKVHATFHEAYFTHMSTSPNYQIIATLDVGRSQMELEGYGMVERQIEAALTIRRIIKTRPRIQNYFRILSPCDMIPGHLRLASEDSELDLTDVDVTTLEKAWLSDDEFVLDPTRLTLFLGKTGIDGDTFKVDWLMNKYNIQINKTSRNSVLFQTNIGTTRSVVIFLTSCLLRCSQELSEEANMRSEREALLFEESVRSLSVEYPSLPDFSAFQENFASPNSVEGVKGSEEFHKWVRDGDIRSAFYMAYDEEKMEYMSAEDALKLIDAGKDVVSSSFVIPYPPGFPIAVPGQLLTHNIINFLLKLDVKEIHGYESKLGLRIFKQSALNQQPQNQASNLCLIKKEDSGKKRVQSMSSDSEIKDVGVNFHTLDCEN